MKTQKISFFDKRNPYWSRNKKKPVKISGKVQVTFYLERAGIVDLLAHLIYSHGEFDEKTFAPKPHLFIKKVGEEEIRECMYGSLIDRENWGDYDEGDYISSKKDVHKAIKMPSKKWCVDEIKGFLLAFGIQGLENEFSDDECCMKMARLLVDKHKL